MPKVIKYFVYIVACSIVFLFLVKSFESQKDSALVASAFEWQKPVQVFFLDGFVDELICKASVAVTRMVPNAETLGLGAIVALINGPTEAEKYRYFSVINPNTLIQNFEIKNRVAYVDFSEDLNKDVAGSCNVIAIRSQIENTLLALPDIDSVVISINGETEGILEP